VAALVLIASVVVVISLPEEAHSYTPRAPILIIGDADFTAANGVTGGSGTPGDPYIIEGWDIAASSAHGIRVANTAVAFTIRNLTVHSGGDLYDGILLEDVAEGSIRNVSASDLRSGLAIHNSRNVLLWENNVSGVDNGASYNSGYAILVRSSTNVTLQANTVSSSYWGIGVYSSTTVRVADNIVRGNNLGMDVVAVDGNLTGNDIGDNGWWQSGFGLRLGGEDIELFANSISNNTQGVQLLFAMNVVAKSNSFVHNGFEILGNDPWDFDSHTIATDNLVNGRPVYYYSNCNGLDVGGIPVGQLIVASCRDVRVTNVSVADTDVGISFAYVTNGTIAASNVSSNNIGGITLYAPSHISLVGNSANRNGGTVNAVGGIYSQEQPWATSDNVTVEGNNVSDNLSSGIYLDAPDFTIVRNNKVIGNRGFGILVGITTHRSSLIVGNEVRSNMHGIMIYNGQEALVTQNIVTGAAYDGIVLEDWLGDTGGSSVTRNLIEMNAGAGVRTHSSDNSTITLNEIRSNGVGVKVDELSISTLVHHNIIDSNLVQAERALFSGDSRWDDGYPSGGNWWSDYVGVDACGGPAQDICPGADGIGDNPYVIDIDTRDRYPLMVSPGFGIVSARLFGSSFEDLVLRWSRSGVDVGPNTTLTYRVLRSLNIGGPWVVLGNISANGSLEYTYRCAGCGHVSGDTNTTFYKIQATGTAPPMYSNLAARYSQAVATGQALLTAPLIQADPFVPAVLQTLPHGAVRTFRTGDADPWKAFYPSRPGDLAELRFGEAFWVTVPADGQYTVAGLLRLTPSITIHPGWNLVGYAAFANETRDQSLAGTPVTRVETFDAVAADPYSLRAVGGSETLIPGQAYWLYATAATLWTQG